MRFALIPLLFTLAVAPLSSNAADDVSAPAAPKTAPAPYVLAGDDAISINVINFPELSSGTVVVPPDGLITVNLLEPISVLGKTTRELADLLALKWRKFVKNPSVTVTLTQKRHESVLIYGSVLRAGTVEFNPALRITEALAMVGGAQQVGDLAHVTLVRKTGEKRVLDVSKPETKAGTETDVVLEVGDVIYVPERHTQVSILGEVNRPGSVDYKDDMTILDALGDSGGVKDTADLASATLLHDGKEQKLDLEALLHKGDISVNTRLRPGDRIIIPEIQNRTYVFGAVSRAGFYNFKEGDRLLDALTNVGGPNAQADLSKIHVIHINKDKTVQGVQQVDLNKFLKDKKPDLKNNITLGPGDVVFIPDRKKGFALTDLFSVLTGASLLRNATSLFTGGR